MIMVASRLELVEIFEGFRLPPVYYPINKLVIHGINGSYFPPNVNFQTLGLGVAASHDISIRGNGIILTVKNSSLKASTHTQT